jgi:hypothetical protein
MKKEKIKNNKANVTANTKKSNKSELKNSKNQSATADRKTYKRFIIDGIGKQALKQQVETLKIKRIRKCKSKKNKYMIALKTSRRVKEV